MIDWKKRRAAQMATYDNTHSTFVARAKVVLPLAAICLLSTLFLFYRGTVSPTDTIIYADVDVSDLAQHKNIRAPKYADVTRDGAAISIQAAEIDPSKDQPSARDTHTRIETRSGLIVDLRARTSSLNPTLNEVELSGGVIVQTSAGYVLKTSNVNSSLSATQITMPATVTAVGPVGRIEAGSARFSQNDGAYVIDFQDGVKMVYESRN
jgi:lipopolysaccharide export system protein LptC